MKHLTLLPFAFLQLSASAAERIEWTGWLGPVRDGWVEHFTPPEKWPEKLEKKWEVEVGIGYGSPLVVGDQVFVHSRQGDDEVLRRLKLSTGEEVWEKRHEVIFKVSPGGEMHGRGPKASPVYSDGRVITMSITGVLSCFGQRHGELFWRKDYGREFKLNRPNWGVAGSPLAEGSNVIAHLGNDDRGALVAIDIRTGSEVWRQGEDGASYSSPLAVRIDEWRQVIDWNHENLVAVDPVTGRLQWSFPAPHRGSDQNMPTPVVHDGMVLLGGENRGIKGLRPKRVDGAWQVEERWHQEKVALDMSTAVINDGLLYGFSHFKSGQFFCLDPNTGDIRWTGPARTGQNVMFLSVPGHIIALINDGELRVIRATGERYQQVASYELGDPRTWAPPVLLPDGVLVKGMTKLTLWSLPR